MDSWMFGVDSSSQGSQNSWLYLIPLLSIICTSFCWSSFSVPLIRTSSETLLAYLTLQSLLCQMEDNLQPNKSINSSQMIHLVNSKPARPMSAFSTAREKYELGTRGWKSSSRYKKSFHALLLVFKICIPCRMVTDGKHSDREQMCRQTELWRLFSQSKLACYK